MPNPNADSDAEAETRPEHQRVFPTHVIEETSNYTQHYYQIHLAGQRWALETGFALMREGRIDPDVVKDTLLSVMDAMRVASMLAVMGATLRDYNTSPTTEHFAMRFGHTLMLALNEKASGAKMRTMLEHLREIQQEGNSK